MNTWPELCSGCLIKQKGSAIFKSPSLLWLKSCFSISACYGNVVPVVSLSPDVNTDDTEPTLVTPVVPVIVPVKRFIVLALLAR
jgi:hypothetical protein